MFQLRAVTTTFQVQTGAEDDVLVEAIPDGALWLVEEFDAGVCLLAGHLRFVAHPTAPEIKVSFDGHARPQIGDTALQLLELIASSIKRLSPLALVEIAPVRAPLSAAG